MGNEVKCCCNPDDYLTVSALDPRGDTGPTVTLAAYESDTETPDGIRDSMCMLDKEGAIALIEMLAERFDIGIQIGE